MDNGSPPASRIGSSCITVRIANPIPNENLDFPKLKEFAGILFQQMSAKPN